MGREGQDYTGLKWACLEVLGKGDRIKDSRGRTCQLWRLKCHACGREFQSRIYKQYIEQSKSCNCRRWDQRGGRHHGEGHRNRTAEYNTWVGMKCRCKHPDRYPSGSYVGKVVCKRWLVYENFLKDMGRKPAPEYSVERLNNDIGYSCGSVECEECTANRWPANCVWATKAAQARNRKVVHLIEWQGETRTMPEWSEALGISLSALRARWRKGLRGDELFAPVEPHRKRGKTGG